MERRTGTMAPVKAGRHSDLPPGLQGSGSYRFSGFKLGEFWKARKPPYRKNRSNGREAGAVQPGMEEALVRSRRRSPGLREESQRKGTRNPGWGRSRRGTILRNEANQSLVINRQKLDRRPCKTSLIAVRFLSKIDLRRSRDGHGITKGFAMARFETGSAVHSTFQPGVIRMKLRPAVLLLIFIVASLIARAQNAPAPHSIGVDDLFDLREARDPQISPDSGFVAYTVTSTSLQDDKSETRSYMVPATGGDAIARLRLSLGQHRHRRN